MGFMNFRGLSTPVFTPTEKDSNIDVASVPNSLGDHETGTNAPPDEKGSPRSSDAGDSDDELNKIDPTAQPGVQHVQAATHVWTRRDLVIAYIL
jgi:hypothetical protein